MNQYGPSLIFEALAPLPPGPQIAKHINIFILWHIYIWKPCYSLFSLIYVCVQCDEVFITLWHPWIQHTVSKDLNKKCMLWIWTQSPYQITYIFYMLLRLLLWCDIYFKLFMGPWSIYIYKMSFVDPCIYRFRATGATCAVAGDRAI